MLRSASIFLLGIAALGSAGSTAELVDVKWAWGHAAHNAFTDLAWFKGRWYCAFREGPAPIGAGTVRVLTSADGANWLSSASFSLPNSDLRDPKLSETPGGSLRLSAAAAANGGSQTMAWFTGDGRTWGEPLPIGDHDFWLWRITWQQNRAYSLGYSTGSNPFLRLYTSPDGFNFQTLAPDLLHSGAPTQSSLVFLSDNTALCLLRRDEGSAHALLGRARPPYRDWTWRDAGVQLASPDMLLLPDGRIVAAAQFSEGRTRTALCWVDPDKATLTEFRVLPSGGDTGYPGLAFHDGLLWVSYYSSHEGKAAIYIATVKLPPA